MKFKNKKTEEVVEAKNYTQAFAYSHNSNWEKIDENPEEETSMTKEEITAILDEKGISYNKNLGVKKLLLLLPEEEV